MDDALRSERTLLIPPWERIDLALLSSLVLLGPCCPSVLCGAEPGHVVQCAEVEAASWTLEERRVREANRTLQQGQVAGSPPRHVGEEQLGLRWCLC